MPASLNIFVVLERKNYLWLGRKHTIHEALSLISVVGFKKPGLFFIHSQSTGDKFFYRAEPEIGVVQVEPPSDY